MNEQHLAFFVEFPGERAAGLHPYTNVVRVTVDADAGGEPGEFAEHIRQALEVWFDGASVEPLADAEARWAQADAP